MTKRVAIYIRVSTERQADKVSPETQEADCRDYCINHGYEIIDIYRDIERYRSSGKMVEPSGTRSDRPQFKRMLADIDSGRIELLIAWREDRLYRGANRAMIEINERVKDKRLEVELVKEHYDPSIATVKAWAAGVELDAKKDRYVMGVTGRLAAGKIWCSRPPYGYDLDLENDNFKINPIEAEWVNKIWTWYAEGMAMKDIRAILIQEMPQRKAGKVIAPWSPLVIREILEKDYYCTGIFTNKFQDKVYEVQIPTLISGEVFQAVRDRNKRFKNYPAPNLKVKALCAGLVYCKSCKCKMGVNWTYGRDGVTRSYHYRCYHISHFDAYQPGCAHTYSMRNLDKIIWTKIWELIDDPTKFEEALRSRLAELKDKEIDVKAESEKLEKRLNDLVGERQSVIAMARKRIITEDDLKIQLDGIRMEEKGLRKDLSEVQLLASEKSERIQQLAELFRERVRIGYEAISKNDENNPEIAELTFQARRRIVQAIIDRIEIDEKKEVRIFAVVDLGNNIQPFRQ